jgi:hypothetical protein
MIAEAEKATLISERDLYLMPATTYSPTHFRVQYNRWTWTLLPLSTIPQC